MHRYDGTKINMLTIIGPTNKRNSSRTTLFECKCDCGNVRLCTLWQLFNDKIYSCGCTRKPNPGIDLSYKRFGRLIVIERIGKKNGSYLWRCQCDCGNVADVVATNLIHGYTKSCGCFASENWENIQKSKIKHGDTNTKLYSSWEAMKARCNNPNHKAYNYYGGRGISVCDEWNEDFSNFKEWALVNDYEEGLTIDRVDSDKNYEPSNCRWIAKSMQNWNKRNNLRLNGKTLNELDINPSLCRSTIANRLHRGWDLDEAISIPKNAGNQKEFIHSRNTNLIPSGLTHGGTGTKLYRIWNNMGLFKCTEWKDFSNFKEWSINNGYEEKGIYLSKPMLKNGEFYSPDNCFWTTKTEVMRRHAALHYKGQAVKTLCETYGLKYKTIFEKLYKNRKKGISDEDTLSAIFDNL